MNKMEMMSQKTPEQKKDRLVTQLGSILQEEWLKTIRAFKKYLHYFTSRQKVITKKTTELITYQI